MNLYVPPFVLNQSQPDRSRKQPYVQYINIATQEYIYRTQYSQDIVSYDLVLTSQNLYGWCIIGYLVRKMGTESQMLEELKF